MIFKMKFFVLLLIVPVILIGCSTNDKPVELKDIPIHQRELEEKLADSRLLRKLDVDEIVLLKVELYHVSIGNSITDDPIGEMFYTIQDGWHLKADNELMEFVPGKGWLIAEQ